MKRLLWCIGLAMTPCLLGCHAIAGTGDFEFSPIVGSWVSVKTIDGNHNRMTIIGNGTGEGTFYILDDTDVRQERDVRIEWEDMGGLFGLAVTCVDADCSDGQGDSFYGTCSYEKPRDWLDCDVDDSTGVREDELKFKRAEDGN